MNEIYLQFTDSKVLFKCESSVHNIYLYKKYGGQYILKLSFTIKQLKFELFTNLQTSDCLSSIRSKGRLSQTKKVCKFAEQAGHGLLLLDGCHSGRGCCRCHGREVRAVVAEVLLDQGHHYLREELDLPKFVIEGETRLKQTRLQK